LPFLNLSSSGDLEYFSDGITEEIINALSKIREYSIIMVVKGRNQLVVSEFSNKS
jgi:TolB-like protein